MATAIEIVIIALEGRPVDKNTTEENLRYALNFAVCVIQNYQADIRARGLDREGFCQGVVYLEAVDMIKRFSEGTSRP